MEAKPTKKQPTKNTLKETKEFLMMLRDCGVMEFSNSELTVKLLPKTVEAAMEEELKDLETSGLMGSTVAKLSNSKKNYDEDLFWSTGR